MIEEQQTVAQKLMAESDKKWFGPMMAYVLVGAWCLGAVIMAVKAFGPIALLIMGVAYIVLTANPKSNG